MLDIFQSGPWRARLGEFAPAKAKRRLTPAGELDAADAVSGFAPKFHTEGNGISQATAPTGHNPAIWNKSKKSTEHDRRKPWTQRLTTARASAPSPAAPADTGTATGGQSISISACSIPMRLPPIRWAKRSITPRNSRASTSTP